VNVNRNSAGYRQQVGLALGGGAVRGVAHVGVLSVLEREGVPIDMVAGTSVGALVGALYCAGLSPAELEYISFKFRWRDFIRLVRPGKGLVSFDRLGEHLVKLLGDITFADLDIPFAAVATDIHTGEMVILREGPLAPAIVASCAVPGLVEPVKIGGRELCDGGIINNLPISVVRQMGAEYVIGVDIFEPKHNRGGGPLGMGLMALELMIDNTGAGFGEADCLIRPPLAGDSYVNFGRRVRTLARGIEAAEYAVPDLRLAIAAGFRTAQGTSGRLVSPASVGQAHKD
jgi:NTE family protein